jgi:hypothetical protein
VARPRASRSAAAPFLLYDRSAALRAARALRKVLLGLRLKPVSAWAP